MLGLECLHAVNSAPLGDVAGAGGTALFRVGSRVCAGISGGELTKGRVPTEADRCKEDGSKFCRPGIGPATAHSMPIDRFVCSTRNGGSGSGGKPAGTLRRLLEADKGGDKDP